MDSDLVGRDKVGSSNLRQQNPVDAVERVVDESARAGVLDPDPHHHGGEHKGVRVGGGKTRGVVVFFHLKLLGVRRAAAAPEVNRHELATTGLTEADASTSKVSAGAA